MRLRRPLPSTLLLFGVLVFSVSVLFSHQGGLGFWLVEIQPEAVRSVLSVSLLDLNFMPELDSDGDGFIEYDDVLRHRKAIESRILEHFHVRDAGQEGTVGVQDFQVLESGELVLKFEHRFSQELTQLELESTFHELTDSQHRVFCKVDDGGEVKQYFFDIYNPRRAIEVSQVSSETLQQMVRFVRLGIEHIFTGYDHLAFLLGLILLGGSIRRLIAIVSSFTVAHSVTLTLATLNVVVLPTRFVESAIALSICYIALENIFVGEISGRWKITFFFGLIHGFGFSNILRAMQLPRRGLVTSLFSFNAGVEIGQVVIITLLCPLIFFVARQRWHKAVVTVTSALIGGFGLMWFLERMS